MKSKFNDGSSGPELGGVGVEPREAVTWQVRSQGTSLAEGATPEETLPQFSTMTEAERQQLLFEWNQTACDYAREKCLHQLIEEHAESRPEQVAVLAGSSRRLTYREFNESANQLAHYLRSRGVGRGGRVGICLESSPELAIAVLAVLKSGAACVPLDPKYPVDRLKYMLDDVQARLVITDRGRLSASVPRECEVILLADAGSAIASQPRTNPTSDVTPEDIAYVIYTSGSTGKPRGVLLTHGGLVNYNTNAARMYDITPQDRVLQFCSISFDIAIEEMFITWLSGASLVMKTENAPLAVPDFLKWTEQQGITVLDLPTAYWHEWVHEFPQLEKVVPAGLRLVIVGGEKPSSQAYEKWLNSAAKRVRWINTYGPTETSICATAFEPKFEAGRPVPENIPIGRPLANVQVYLLDSDLNPVPVGVDGEIHVGGAGVARGYLNRPELTAEKFIPDPFSPEPEARLYKTGDRARYLPSGDIEFLGRVDDQIKIRGFRVEPGEIETLLSKYPGIRDAAVVAIENADGGKQLAAYFTVTPESKVAVTELRRYLQEQLPDYMVPSAFVALPVMPLTPNGKINRRELPVPQFETSAATFAVATGPLQAQLVGIWEEVLGKRPIGIRDNFFELGGHSLLAARLMHRAGQKLGKALPLAMLFHAPTIEQLAAVLGQDEWSRHWSSLVPIQPSGSQPAFFCIHGVGGNVLGFHLLGRHMAPEYPFYGLQAQGLDGKNPCLTSIEAMAAHYISEMRSVQPHGPYFLGGFSFGGLVAYEVAQQLRSAGEDVGLLVLFDTYPGDVKAGTVSLLRVLLNPSRKHWLHDVPRALGKKIRRTWRGLHVPKALWDVHTANRAAASKYVLQPYPGKITLVRATEKPLEGSFDPHALWKDMAGSLVVHEIASDHYDILLEPQVRHLSDRLKSWIGAAKSECEHAGTSLQAS
jgi:amino acid adenylation domain-containing protein